MFLLGFGRVVLCTCLCDFQASLCNCASTNPTSNVEVLPGQRFRPEPLTSVVNVQVYYTIFTPQCQLETYPAGTLVGLYPTVETRWLYAERIVRMVVS